MAECLDEPRPGRVRLEGRELREGVRANRLAKEDEVAGIPGIPLVFSQALGDPGWCGAAREDVESEDVGDLVGEKPEPLIRRDVDPEQDAFVSIAGASRDIRRTRSLAALEIGGRLEEDERNLEAEVVAQVYADAFVGAFRLARDALGVQIE